MKKIPFILVTGFLGSGKTSLLKNLLAEISDKVKVAVVQNEFAPGTTDSKELQRTGLDFNLLEINNGSVFCACLLNTFISRLSDFISQFQPEVIILEATGLADPISLGQILQSEEVNEQIYLAGIWTVVDCLNFSKAHQFIGTVKHQIQMADVLLLNKTDLNKPGKNLLDQLDTLNKQATRILTVKGFADQIADTFMGQIFSAETARLDNIFQIEETGEKGKRPNIGSCVIRSSRPITRKKVEDFWNMHRDKIQRMKGFVRTPDNEYLSVQSVYDRLIIERTENWNGQTELIFMGEGVHPHWISEILIRNN